MYNALLTGLQNVYLLAFFLNTRKTFWNSENHRQFWDISIFCSKSSFVVSNVHKVSHINIRLEATVDQFFLLAFSLENNFFCTV